MLFSEGWRRIVWMTSISMQSFKRSANRLVCQLCCCVLRGPQNLLKKNELLSTMKTVCGASVKQGISDNNQ